MNFIVKFFYGKKIIFKSFIEEEKKQAAMQMQKKDHACSFFANILNEK